MEAAEASRGGGGGGGGGGAAAIAAGSPKGSFEEMLDAQDAKGFHIKSEKPIFKR